MTSVTNGWDEVKCCLPNQSINDTINFILRANVSRHQTNSGKSPKFVFTPTFIFCSPICSNNCGVVFLWKYILVFEKWLFSFDRSHLQISTVDITQVVWPHVTNVQDLFTNCSDLCQLTVATSRRTMYISYSLSSKFCRTSSLSQDGTTQIHKEIFTVTL